MQVRACARLLCTQTDYILELRKRPKSVIANPLWDEKPLVLIKTCQLGSYCRTAYVLLACVLACTQFHLLFP